MKKASPREASVRKNCQASGIGKTSASSERLLQAMTEPEAALIEDPLDENRMILRLKRKGLSVGGGGFSRLQAEDLLRRDLIMDASPGTRKSFKITSAGRAHLKRMQAPAEEAFRAQHIEIVETPVERDRVPAIVSFNPSESPLAWLRRRKDKNGDPMIDAVGFEAGERLRRDLTLAGALPGVTSRWDPAGGGRGGDPGSATDAMVAARQRVMKALGEIGSDFADVLIDLCGFLKGIALIEHERGWPPRSAKLVIGLALKRLAEHYGLRKEARGGERTGRAYAWREGASGV